MMDFTPSHFSSLSSSAPISSAPSLMPTASGIAMRHSTPPKRQVYDLKPSFVGERVAEFLHKRHPTKTADNVAADLTAWSISRDTIGQMLQRQTAPGAVMMLALIWAYGPEFLSEVHPAPLGWLSVASREQRKEALEIAMAKLRAEMDELK